jgi:succinate dehydrogenase hydrophobic anchor subunit
VVIEDYIRSASKPVVLVAVRLACLILVTTGSFAVVHIALHG